MIHAEATAARLQREAERCERLSAGVSDPALIRSLRAWAEDYRREAAAALDLRRAA